MGPLHCKDPSAIWLGHLRHGLGAATCFASDGGICTPNRMPSPWTPAAIAAAFAACRPVPETSIGAAQLTSSNRLNKRNLKKRASIDWSMSERTEFWSGGAGSGGIAPKGYPLLTISTTKTHRSRRFPDLPLQRRHGRAFIAQISLKRSRWPVQGSACKWAQIFWTNGDFTARFLQTQISSSVSNLRLSARAISPLRTLS